MKMSDQVISPLVSNIYISELWVSIGSGKWHQAITWTNVSFLSIGPLGTDLSENRI